MSEIKNIFDEIIVSTDSIKYKRIALEIPKIKCVIRPKKISEAHSPDIEWIRHLNSKIFINKEDALFILRPSSPLRTINFILKAWDTFKGTFGFYDSLRAVKKVDKHPGKMWIIQSDMLFPLFPFHIDGTPWHSSQTAVLPEVFEQTASLEILWGSTLIKKNSLAGNIIMPFIASGNDAFDINNLYDFERFKEIIYGQKN